MKLLNEMFGSFNYSACRIETLPIYKIIGDEWDRYQLFINGEIREKYNSSGWSNMLSNYKEIGKSVERIRVIPEELNSYLRFEIEACYVQNMIAGEKIKMIDKSKYDKLVTSITKGDYWIFDNDKVLYMEYDEDGAFLKSNLIKDDKVRKECIKFYNVLNEKTYEINEVLKKIRNTTINLKN